MGTMRAWLSRAIVEAAADASAADRVANLKTMIGVAPDADDDTVVETVRKLLAEAAAPAQEQMARNRLDSLAAAARSEGHRVDFSADRRKLTITPSAFARARGAKVVVHEINGSTHTAA